MQEPSFFKYYSRFVFEPFTCKNYDIMLAYFTHPPHITVKRGTGGPGALLLSPARYFFDFRYVSLIESAFSLASALQLMLSVMVLCLVGIQFLSVNSYLYFSFCFSYGVMLRFVEHKKNKNGLSKLEQNIYKNIIAISKYLTSKCGSYGKVMPLVHISILLINFQTFFRIYTGILFPPTVQRINVRQMFSQLQCCFALLQALQKHAQYPQVL